MTLVITMPAAADPPTPAPVDTIVVYFDQSRLIQLPQRAANIVIGNPLIATSQSSPAG